MPLLGQLIANLFAGLVGGIASQAGKKTAAALALITALGAAFGVCYLALDALIDAIAVVSPAFLTVPASWVVPDNVAACISARVSAGLAVFAYRWSVTVTTAAAAA